MMRRSEDFDADRISRDQLLLHLIVVLDTERVPLMVRQYPCDDSGTGELRVLCHYVMAEMEICWIIGGYCRRHGESFKFTSWTPLE